MLSSFDVIWHSLLSSIRRCKKKTWFSEVIFTSNSVNEFLDITHKKTPIKHKILELEKQIKEKDGIIELINNKMNNIDTNDYNDYYVSTK